MANCTSYPLLNGKAIPSIGYGTYKLYDSECVNSVRDAIEQGFRLIDTAYLYKNEEAVVKVYAQPQFRVKISL